MAGYRKPLTLLAFIAVLVLLWLWLRDKNFFSLSYIKWHQISLTAYIANHYATAATLYVLLIIATALIIPGAIVLTMAGGALFGVLPAMIYVNIGTVIGGMITFVVTRYVVGESLHDRYRNHLELFNREVKRHGRNYLLTLRIVPILPAFIINCLAGLTRLPLSTFLWTTCIGVLPGSFVYAFAGRRIAEVSDPRQILTWPVVVSLLLLGLFSMLPVLVKHGRRWKRRRRPKA